MSRAYRVSGGSAIDRTQPLSFQFDAKTYGGFVGDTLASALLANGVHLMGRSFKYHRPRGVMACGSDEANALVTVIRDAARVTPNLRATQVELYDGLVATSQNRWPSLAWDIGAVNSLLARFIPAGFYYKTFMWPAKAWAHLYEPVIRAAAGLGVAPTAPDTDVYTNRYAHCDVLVVGAGPAGLAAASAAAAQGSRVILCDEQPRSGEDFGALTSHPRVRILSRTTAFGYYPHNLIGLCQVLTDHLGDPTPDQPRERLWQVRAKEVVLATGAIERPLVFAGNDRPGILLAGAALTFLQRYGVSVGRRVALVTAHDSAYDVALQMQAAGIGIAVVADVRQDPDPALLAKARAAGLRVITGARITGTSGRLRVAALRLAGGRRIGCDTILMAGGFTPNISLFSQSRGSLVWDEDRLAFVVDKSPEAVRAVGTCASEGLAGPGVIGAPAMQGGAGEAFVDFQNDVTVKDILLATREGFASIEHVKRYTTTGMATDQGKTSNLNALGVVAQALGVPVPDVGLTTFRPPYTPVSFGTLAGRSRGLLFDPVRTTPLHGWAEQSGAVFEDVGLWKRARYFPRGQEDMHAAVARECLAVRGACGIFDASTLGKIEVVGADAALFLERFYINAWAKLGIGRCRYGVLLREDGFVSDDGVVGRLAEDRFHVTTTTGGAAAVMAMMEDYLQTEWPDLRVWLTSTTEQWAVIALQGPKARDILSPLIENLDISPQAFPHMCVADAQIGDIPVRLMRVSFTGELGFEINVPAGRAREVWDKVYAAGQAFGLTPYGTEAMHVLRAEKGFVIVGQETDGTATPDDVGLSWAIGKKKRDFVGKRSLDRPAMRDSGRKQLVGLFTHDPNTVLEEGAQLCATAATQVPIPLIGHVTSAYFSPSLGRSIALAMLAGGRARVGETIYVPMADGRIPVTVCGTVFIDPQGERVNG